MPTVQRKATRVLQRPSSAFGIRLRPAKTGHVEVQAVPIVLVQAHAANTSSARVCQECGALRFLV